jgi:hypothetical protein
VLTAATSRSGHYHTEEGESWNDPT